MKSIYSKITIVLVVGFLLQVALILVFYNEVAVKRVISVINEEENVRQTIMREAVFSTQKISRAGGRPEMFLEQYSRKHNVSFMLKNMDGQPIFETQGRKDNTCVIEDSYIRCGPQKAYILEGYFPAGISLGLGFKEGRIRFLYIAVIFIVALAVLLVIYKVLAEPLKKLSLAAKDLNYGNTVVKIPYYGEDELGLLCRNFEDMGMRLKDSEDAQQELIQAISHDVKTPLTSIIGYSKRLLDNKVCDDKKEEYFETIYRKANDLKFLLEELDEYTNINLENIYNKKVVDLGVCFKDILEELKREVAQKGCSLQYTLGLSKNINVNIDIRKMKRVLVNIIENSLKYAGEKCTINVIVSDKSKNVMFEIYDNGPGVPQSQINKIFDRFFRVESSRCREKGGTGLGLSICREIIKNHNGEIGAFNKDDKGLCVWFTLPYIKTITLNGEKPEE